MNINDQTFLEQFENRSLNAALFNHYGHLRLAWLYLRKYPLERAVEKVTRGISAYAGSLGAAGKYQHTLTEAIVRIMAGRLRNFTGESLDVFLAANPDLVDDIVSVVKVYYSDALLNSPVARAGFVSPDLRPLEELEVA